MTKTFREKFGTAILLAILCGWIPSHLFALTETMKVADASGKVWALDTTWREDERPYAKNLITRESNYETRWGEKWKGSLRLIDHAYLMSPGNWTWEEIVIPNGKAKNVTASGRKLNSRIMVYAPNGGDTVTDIYATTIYGFYHINAQTREITYHGNPTEYSRDGDKTIVDGLDGEFHMYGGEDPALGFTVDPISGRIYFYQEKEVLYSGSLLRYIEKLLPYQEEGGEVILLPAFLDYGEMYKKVKGPKGGTLSPIINSHGKRAKPWFQVKSLCPVYPAGSARPFISANGRTAYAIDIDKKSTYPFTMVNVHAYNTLTGNNLGPVLIPSWPTPIPGQTAACATFDNWIYNCEHRACCGGGRGWLVRWNPATGVKQMLYDNNSLWGDSLLNGQAYIDKMRDSLQATENGPADAITLGYTTTSFQFQCPRTGAVMNGGWDGAGIVRYHDGFVTMQIAHNQNGMNGGRPEWGNDKVSSFGTLMSCPDVAPNGDIYCTSIPNIDFQTFPNDTLRTNGIRVLRLHRTDWPAQQPLNGYANQFVSPAARESLMIEYATVFIDSGRWLKAPPGQVLVSLIDSVTQMPVTSTASLTLLHAGVVVNTASGFSRTLTLSSTDTGHNYTVNAAPAGYMPVSADIEIKDNWDTTHITLTCARQALTGVAIQPDSMWIGPNAQQSLALFGIYADGSRLPLYRTYVPTWTSHSPDLFSVDSTGLLKTGMVLGNGVVAGGLASLGFKDSIRVYVITPPMVKNCGFESPTIATYQYNPTDSAWTFSNGSGIWHNGSVWSSINAPNGVQAAFIQGQGTISQSVFFQTASSYKVTCLSAKRSDDNGSLQITKVYLDSIEIGSFSPQTTIFQAFETGTVYVSQGFHTLKFSGTTTLDRTDFIDSVSILPSSGGVDDEPGIMVNSGNPVLCASPNPFNPSVMLSVSGWKAGATLSVIDVRGKVVADLTSVLNSGSSKGMHRVSWNASGHASGLYLFVLRYGKMELKRKAMLIR